MTTNEKIERVKNVLPMLKKINKEDNLFAMTVIDGLKDKTIYKMLCCIKLPESIKHKCMRKAYGRDYPVPYILMEMQKESIEIQKFILKNK